MADREALIEIYQTNNGAEWRFQQEWLGPAGTENRWEGVRVENGHVIELDPSGKGLTGFLSPAMGDLRQLRRIDLDFGVIGTFPRPAFNELEGLPNEIVELQAGITPNLASFWHFHMKLSHNGFTGTLPDDIFLNRSQSIVPGKSGNASSERILADSNGRSSGDSSRRWGYNKISLRLVMSQKDIDFVLSKRHDNGADYWATPDGRVGVGDPFSTITSLVILHELGLDRKHEAVQGALDQILEGWREKDGRIRVAPKGTMHPCHTAVAARALCRYGLASDARLQQTFQRLIETRHTDGGWRCRKFSGGRGPETEFSNPGVTLWALDAFRFLDPDDERLEQAVESLLHHWTVRKPIGPCHFGIGTLFMQTEYPFLRYNLFYYVYVLSFYKSARKDARFREAFEELRSKADPEGRMIIERPHLRLRKLELCKKGAPSEQATRRYQEIVQNLSLED